jgi:hypothetical protein
MLFFAFVYFTSSIRENCLKIEGCHRSESDNGVTFQAKVKINQHQNNLYAKQFVALTTNVAIFFQVFWPATQTLGR